MEVLGMITLRVTDDKHGRIRLIVNNNDNKGLQLQVRPAPSGGGRLLRRRGSNVRLLLSDAPQRGQEAVLRRLRDRPEEPGEVLPPQQRRGRPQVETTDHGRVPHSANQ